MKIERKEFELPPNAPDEARRRWRKAVGFIVKNRRRRFRDVVDLDKKDEDEAKKSNIQVRFLSSPSPRSLDSFQSESRDRVLPEAGEMPELGEAYVSVDRESHP